MGYVSSKELEILTSYAASEKDTTESLNLIASGTIPVNLLITHRYSLDVTQKAFDHARSGDQAKNIQKNSSKEAIPTKTIQNHTHKTKNTIHAKCMILLYGHIFNSILF